MIECINPSIINSIPLIRPSESEYHYSYYPIPNTDDVIQVKLKRSSNCTAFKTWEACFAFLEWMVSNQSLFHNKRVLELGSGSGLCGQMMQAIIPSCSVVMSDYCDEVAEYIQGNVEESTQTNSLFNRSDCF